ncbi:SDR family NAD(P)-dependent oxidoreductase [Noviherbaspirillum sp.]|uniref:SDR family NAD(P)-dependent oxidoreductase n=1 Tax=Noviherbaspirillum sp. TaxID=1926288 RepID=UPI002B46F3C2|nr:SDR family oxidoreductase [Noviherbaspirillum sp.]HJV79991.1 SDR family oxidoreductase [Noviherbaspirillum sp.]
MDSIQGMGVLVTGGGSGIGAGIARYFADRGALVTICGRREDTLRQTAQEIGASCAWAAGDITRGADRTRILERAVSHAGRLDLLVNNAANMLRAPITELDEQAVLEVFNTNVVAAMMLTGLAVPHLEQTQGTVIFLGSVHTRRAYPGAAAYAATKGAVEALTRVLAAELGDKQVRVSCVVPGAVSTELNIRAGICTEDEHAQRMNAIASSHVLGRIGTEDEIAQAIAYLACARWTTGASLVVDGGLSLGLSRV